ncbi:CpXC domain-containing protein [Adlercreutzia faecimuris]|uniref:CpXC domain-containing protein n=1 Tax=Adlercreutzia faecimuris TaxID=2897341 RepID=A0ABS9WI59_9ACTN|nr:CpXC domain-containing protein [Adlercreutzia sp. JBNU-10]
MHQAVTCPACGEGGLDVASYDSMMVLRPDVALFSLTCPRCGAKVSSLQPIPAALRDEVRFAAIELGAGMGQG